LTYFISKCILFLKVDENPNDFKQLFAKKRELEFKKCKKYGSNCIGPPYFIFRPFKTEKERVKESVQENQYLQTIPLEKNAFKHDFRNRDRNKEIQPEMRFASKNNVHIVKYDESTASVLSKSPELNKSNLEGSKLHFKSAFSLMFGSPKPKKTRLLAGSQTNLISENQTIYQNNNAKPILAPMSLNGTIKNKEKFDIKKDSMLTMYKSKDPIVRAAEHALTKCFYITQKKNVMYNGAGRRQAVKFSNLEEPEAQPTKEEIEETYSSYEDNND